VVIRSHKSRIGLASQRSFSFARPAPQAPPQVIRRRHRRGRIRIIMKQSALFIVLALIPVSGWAWYQGHIASGWEGAKAKMVALSLDAGFELERVRATGQVRTSDEAILEALGTRAGDALFAMDMTTLSGRIETLPWVSKASVTRELPNTLQVWIEERKPFVRWQMEGKLMVVDEAGRKIIGADVSDFSNLPFVVGPGAPEAARDLFDLLGSHETLARRVVSAIRVGQRRWDLEFDNGMRLKLPEPGPDYGPAEAWQAFIKVEKERGVMNLMVATFDLRLSDRVVLKLTPEGKKIFANKDQKT